MLFRYCWSSVELAILSNLPPKDHIVKGGIVADFYLSHQEDFTEINVIYGFLLLQYYTFFVLLSTREYFRVDTNANPYLILFLLSLIPFPFSYIKLHSPCKSTRETTLVSAKRFQTLFQNQPFIDICIAVYTYYTIQKFCLREKINVSYAKR